MIEGKRKEAFVINFFLVNFCKVLCYRRRRKLYKKKEFCKICNYL